ncbi:uncharacterized protein KZ484_001251 [Pholidichthys leucotaenia]
MLSDKMCRSIFQQPRLHDDKEKEVLQADSRKKHSWAKRCRGRVQGRRTGVGGGWPRVGSHRHRHPRHHPHHRGRHPQRPVLSLRPVNRARGMQAPKNTNQFLMGEKYEMLHMRSDSVGSDGGSSSDSDMELTDMDSYLGVLENARGALQYSPNPYDSTMPPRPFLVLREVGLHPQESLLLQGSSLRLQEESMQYFPSEDDLMQSQNFMQKDFVEFCETWHAKGGTLGDICVLSRD